jgi:hypothetical protein
MNRMASVSELSLVDDITPVNPTDLLPCGGISNGSNNDVPLVTENPASISSPSLFPSCPVPIHAGYVPSYQRLSCSIIVEGWPAWALVVGALNFKWSALFAADLSWSGFGLTPIPSPFSASSLSSRDRYIFLSGSQTFISPFWSAFSTSHILVIALDRHSMPLPSWRQNGTWFLLHHKDFDGVTDGSWWCGLSRITTLEPSRLRSIRRLRHVLDARISGRTTIPAPSDESLSFDEPHFVTDRCHPGGLWPLDRPNIQCFCPSAFTKGWVSRPLSTQEMARCMDLPASKVDSLPCPQKIESWLQSAPPKILLALGKLALTLNPGQPLGHHILSDKQQEIPHPRFGLLACKEDNRLPSVKEVTEFSPVLDPGVHVMETTNQDGGIKCLPSAGQGGAILEHTLEVPKSLPECTAELGRERAAKNDDAEVPVHLWDDPFWDDLPRMKRVEKEFFTHHGRQLKTTDCLRSWLLRVWRRSVYLSFRKYMRSTHGPSWYAQPSQDAAAGRDCLRRTALADFWEWHGGSRLYFWRWPAESRAWARDGHPVYLTNKPAIYKRPQPPESDLGIKDMVKKKLVKFIDRDYVSAGRILSLMSYFTVPKGDSDVRVVFDGTKSGLNAAIYAPTFSLPTVETLLPKLEVDAWQGDIDVGEQFYNYMLDPTVQQYCGIDITPYFGRKRGGLNWLRWNQCVMGLRSSPHGCVKMHSLGEEVVRGDHLDPKNPFFFDSVRLNLPGAPTYDPGLPRVAKFRSDSGKVAGDMVTYVDDKRVTAGVRALCLQVCHRVGSRLCYLGEQDALRKHSPISKRAGAWAGAVVHTDVDGISVLCTREKWSKAQSYVLDMQNRLTNHQGVFDFKTLEQQRGFLVYVSRTYPVMVPYLKGIHLTLDS